MHIAEVVEAAEAPGFWESVFPWLGFLGAWLLFAGPVYQAAVELHEEGFDEDEQQALRSRAAELPPPPRISAWWWLLPPVAYVMSVRRSKAWRREMFRAIPAEQRQHFITFQNKAAGWLIVAAGAVLIAIKETAELVEHNAWPGWAFAPLLIPPFLLSVGYTVSRMHRTRQLEAAEE
ncbi:MAG: hypothetical protein J7480_07110 [Microbacteriaceae bacterium]|nr:hypothetical protein [Microbacteriaceae bacterium]